jgi:hypothetical protein
MGLFIDTNIFLSFYHLSSDDLEELRKLDVLLERKKLALYLPTQVIDEHQRNRDGKIDDALKRFRDQRLSLQFPQICKDYPEYDKLRDLQEQYRGLHATLLRKIESDVIDESLKADEIIHKLFSRAHCIPLTDELFAKAQRRRDLGNPPGKRDSLGDAINWEALMATVPRNDPLYFVSDDGDYCSARDDSEFNSFLAQEWTGEKAAPVLFYKRLSDFFKDTYPEIKLASDLDKNLLINDLVESRNFQSTYRYIGRLAKYGVDFSDSELNALVEAAVENDQIAHIIADADVHDFYRSIIKGREASIEPHKLDALLHHLAPPKQDADDEPIF